jgi:hypothetical protein
MTEDRAHIQVFSSRIPVHGWGGFVLILSAIVLAIILPEVRPVLAVGAAGGALIALLLIARRRRVKP